MANGVVVGIDLGTTYSVCAIVENGRARVVSDAGGSYTIPSIVAIDDKGNRLVGQAAKRQSEINPLNTVYGAKRLVGRDIHSHLIDEIEKHVRYRIEEGDNEDVAINLRRDRYALEEIQAMILDHVRNLAQDVLGKEIAKAVVTVPAYFNDRQRQAVRDAGQVAQLEVLRIINEPTAAALAYGHGKDLKQKVVIFDLGGGTFDVTVLDIRGEVFEVKSTGGNTFLGGVDFDNAIIDKIAADFKDQHAIDLTREPMSHQRLKDAAEQAKIDLSSRPETRIHVPYIAQGPDGPITLDVKLTRDEFNALIKPKIDQTIDIAARVISESGWKNQDLDAILLVGGSTRIPLVAQMVEEFFGKPPSKNVHPDEAVALGAAILADSIVNHDSDIKLLDVLPINLNLALPTGKTLPLFQRNSSVPNQKLKIFTTSKDNQDTLKIKLVQGDSEKVDECEAIGDFVFRGIHPAPKGMAKVEATFIINNEGILHITARDPDSGVEQTGTLQVSDCGARTFKHQIEKKEPPKKEAQKVITSSVTREVKLNLPTPPPKPPDKKAASKSGPQTPITGPGAPAKPITAPRPEHPKPVYQPKPGLLDRIKAFFAGKKK
jgi:molecular chaperone DnaK